MKDKDIKHLEWVYERMKYVHNENENYDYMIRFREILEALRQPLVSGSLLERVMLALDDYLNAGCKETRKQAAEKAKVLYKEYYGVDYVNRNDR